MIYFNKEFVAYPVRIAARRRQLPGVVDPVGAVPVHIPRGGGPRPSEAPSLLCGEPGSTERPVRGQALSRSIQELRMILRTMWFILNLKKKMYSYQFGKYACTSTHDSHSGLYAIFIHSCKYL